MSKIAPRPENLAALVLEIRGERVLLDTDLARLYGVEGRVLNQAVGRNRGRFPRDFMFRLTTVEYAAVRERSPMSSQSVMTSPQRRALRYRPWAFTEQGVAMVSSVLRSPRAVAVNVAIMRTFVQLRRLMDGNRDLARQILALEQKYDEQFAVVFEAIRRLVSDDPDRTQPRKRIGFETAGRGSTSMRSQTVIARERRR